jgi:hypothetical protein
MNIVFIIPFLFLSLSAMPPEPEISPQEKQHDEFVIPFELRFLDDSYFFTFMNGTKEVFEQQHATKISLTYYLSCSTRAVYRLPTLEFIITSYIDEKAEKEGYVVTYKIRDPNNQSAPIMPGVHTFKSRDLFNQFPSYMLQMALFDKIYKHTPKKCCKCSKEMHRYGTFDARVLLACGHIFHVTCVSTKNNPQENAYILAEECPVCHAENDIKNCLWREACPYTK